MNDLTSENSAQNEKSQPYSDISFDPRPEVHRVKLPVFELWINSAKETSRAVAQCGLYNQSTIVGAPEHLSEITNELENPLIHKGRSNSKVVDTDPSILRLRSENDHIFTYKPNKSNFVYKTNPDKNVTNLELALYKTFRHVNLPVPFACAHEQGIIVDHLGHETLAKEISELFLMATSENAEKVAEKTLNTFKSIPELLPLFAKYTNSTLDDLFTKTNINYKEYLKQKEIQTIAEKFNGDHKLVSKYPFTFNLLKNSSGLTLEEAREYAKLEHLFQDGIKKFGIYSVEIHPNNILRPREPEENTKYDFKIIDFNKTKLFMAQELDSLLYDVATPIIKELFSLLPAQHPEGHPVTNFCTNEEKQELSLKSLQAHNKELGKNWSEEEYMQYLPLAKFYVAKQLMDKTFKEFAEAKTFQDVIKYSTEFIHYAILSKEAIPKIEKNFFNGENKLKSLHSFIIDNQIKPFYEIIGKLKDKTNYWLYNKEIPQDKDIV